MNYFSAIYTTLLVYGILSKALNVSAKIHIINLNFQIGAQSYSTISEFDRPSDDDDPDPEFDPSDDDDQNVICFKR